MCSIESSKQHWGKISAADRIEIGLVQAQVTYDRRLHSIYSAVERERLNDFVKDSFHTIAEYRGGKLYSWNNSGGAFMFLAEDADSYDICCLAAIQMVEMMPSLSEDLRPSDDLACPIELRVSCDAGMVAYDPQPSNMPVDFAMKLATHGDGLGTEGRVTITELLIAV